MPFAVDPLVEQFLGDVDYAFVGEVEGKGKGCNLGRDSAIPSIKETLGTERSDDQTSESERDQWETKEGGGVAMFLVADKVGAGQEHQTHDKEYIAIAGDFVPECRQKLVQEGDGDACE